jgi:hypothetical protein
MVHGSLRIGVVYMAGVLAGETRSHHHRRYNTLSVGRLNKPLTSATGLARIGRLFFLKIG